MREIEVKILEAKHEDLEKKLHSIGARKVFDGKLHTIFFDTKDSRLKNSNETFRLRKKGTKAFVTHKRKIQAKYVKAREETEIEVSDFEITRRLILSLGFKESLNTIKRRVTYQMDSVVFEFDIYDKPYDFIPEFLEIEANRIDKIYKYADLLGFSKKECKAWSTKELIRHYSR